MRDAVLGCEGDSLVEPCSSNTAVNRGDRAEDTGIVVTHMRKHVVLGRTYTPCQGNTEEGNRKDLWADLEEEQLVPGLKRPHQAKTSVSSCGSQ